MNGIGLKGCKVIGYTSGAQRVEEHPVELVLGPGGAVILQMPPKEAWQNAERVTGIQFLMMLENNYGETVTLYSGVCPVEAQK